MLCAMQTCTQYFQKDLHDIGNIFKGDWWFWMPSCDTLQVLGIQRVNAKYYLKMETFTFSPSVKFLIES